MSGSFAPRASPRGTLPADRKTMRRPYSQIPGLDVLAKLSSGGMGEILLARRRGLHGFEKLLAVKVIKSTLAQRPAIRAMFSDEARLVARLDHPTIAQVYDYGEAEDTFYLAMEYVPGIALNHLIRRSAFPPLIAARIASEVARGLHAAHELQSVDGRFLGVVHRDISPGNLILTFDGRIKILDFGIAFMNERESPDTGFGEIKGKPSYMAPEQIRGESVNRRSDIYSLSVVLHEMLTGRKLFNRSNVVATALAVERDPVRPPSTLVYTPDGLDDIVMRGLARRAEDRFNNARQFADALDELIHQEKGTSLEAFAEKILEEDRRAHRSWLKGILDGGRADGSSLYDATLDNNTPAVAETSPTRFGRRHRMPARPTSEPQSETAVRLRRPKPGLEEGSQFNLPPPKLRLSSSGSHLGAENGELKAQDPHTKEENILKPSSQNLEVEKPSSIASDQESPDELAETQSHRSIVRTERIAPSPQVKKSRQKKRRTEASAPLEITPTVSLRPLKQKPTASTSSTEEEAISPELDDVLAQGQQASKQPTSNFILPTVMSVVILVVIGLLILAFNQSPFVKAEEGTIVPSSTLIPAALTPTPKIPSQKADTKPKAVSKKESASPVPVRKKNRKAKGLPNRSRRPLKPSVTLPQQQIAPRSIKRRQQEGALPPPLVVTEPIQVETPKTYGWLSVDATPYAIVIIDGVNIGVTPIVRHQLNTGPHQIKLLEPKRHQVRFEKEVVIREERLERVTARKAKTPELALP